MGRDKSTYEEAGTSSVFGGLKDMQGLTLTSRRRRMLDVTRYGGKVSAT